MSEMQEYQSSLGDPNSRKFETFSYLPEMNQEDIQKQVKVYCQQGLESGDRTH
jgi:ribulose-bisphosphate carboxylase small chain